MMDMGNQIVVYKASDGNELAIKTDGETVWMTIEQMVKLLGRDRTVLIRHINNAIKEGELRRDINVQNLHNIHAGFLPAHLHDYCQLSCVIPAWSRA